MEFAIVLLIVVVTVAVVLLVTLPLARSDGAAAEADPRGVAIKAHENKQFTKPPNEGGLL